MVTLVMALIGALLAIGVIIKRVRSVWEDSEKLAKIWWSVIRGALTALGLFTISGYAIQILADNYTDYLWYREVGYVQVWLTPLVWRWALFIIGTLVVWVILSFNHRLVVRSALPIPTESRKVRRERGWGSYETIDLGEEWRINEEIIFWISRIVKWVVSLVLGFWVASDWETILKSLNQVPFGVGDPIRGLDISWYIFTLPALGAIRGYLFVLLLLAGIWAAVLYAILGLRTRELYDQKKAQEYYRGSAFVYVRWVAVLLLVWMAFFFWLGQWHRIADGGGYVDIQILLGNYNTFFWLVILVALGVFVVSYFSKGWIMWAVPAAVVFVLMTGLLWLQPAFVQTFQVNPSQLDYEKPYIAHRIQMTRQAYGLDQIEVKDFQYQTELTPSEYQVNNPTLSQARVMDWRPLVDANKTLQGITLFYDFPEVDLDRYDGREYMVSVRELNSDHLPKEAKNWSNIHFQYTHGEGFTVAEVSSTESQGLPAYVVKDIPPKGPEPFRVKYPQIYFGEITSTPWIVVNSTLEEFGRPTAAGAEYERYEGRAGIELDGLNRLAFTLRFGDLQLLLSGFIRPESRIVLNRTLKERVQKIAPILRYDNDPYPVIGPDRVYRVWDAYTTAWGYPYSEGSGGFNYIRNSVKVVVDAYEGTTTFYAVDPNEPVLRVWANILPGLFKPIADMPSFLRDHLRYPEDLFTMQAKKLSLYHMVDPVHFYNREDLWAIPKEAYQDKHVDMDPRYVRMRLPGEPTDEFTIILPFTPAGGNRQNLVGWLAARIDGEHYGELKLLLFPRDQTVIGPQQVEGLINQDPALATQITLWNQQGSKVLWGNLITLPVLGQERGSVIYVKPLFLLAEQGKIPALTRVIVVTSSSKLIVKPSLEEALKELYGSQLPVITRPAESGKESTVQDLIRQAQDHFAKLQVCAGKDWRCFADEMEALQRVFQQLGNR